MSAEQVPSKYLLQKIDQRTIDFVCAGGGSQSERDAVWNYIHGLERENADLERRLTDEPNERSVTGEGYVDNPPPHALSFSEGANTNSESERTGAANVEKSHADSTAHRVSTSHGPSLEPVASLYPHWTCKTHGDFDARVVVGCPECVREMRTALPPLPKTCEWSEIEEGCGVYNTCSSATEGEFHVYPGLELWPHCQWCGGKIVVTGSTKGATT